MSNLARAKILSDIFIEKLIPSAKKKVDENYYKLAKRNADYFDRIVTDNQSNDESVDVKIADRFVFKDIPIMVRNPDEHQIMINNLAHDFKIKNTVSTIEELKENYNIDSFLSMKSRRENKTATADEKKLLTLSKSLSIIPAITVEKFKEIDGEMVLVQKGGVKAIGIAFPTADMFDFDFEEIFFINSRVSNDVWGNKGIKFNSDSSASENLVQLLNYMETSNISDLHFKLFDESNYSYTARQKTKIIKIGDGFSNIETTNNLINQILYRSNRETQVDDGEEVRSLLVQTLNNGITRNFRFHMKESTYNNTRGKSVSLRRLPREEELKSLEGLGYSLKASTLIKNVLRKSSDGIVIVSGATNSGKTTFLNSTLVYIRDELNRRIHRIENPAEVALKDIVTFDLMDRKNSEKPPTLSDFISSIFSQDPDVALIGEARKDEELVAAFELARTGHLALLTVHAKDNEAALSRIIDAKGINKADFNDKVRMAINQHLAGKLCPHCKDKMITNEENNCSHCGGSGVITVIPVYEITAYLNLASKDDISDTAKLVEEKKAIHISKEEVLEEYKKNGWIDTATYEDIVFGIEDLVK
ncbi:MAG: ATPase, T2SS/T4P/T4SS family [Desulfuromonadaceae bacterium]|nr:ATPase, T2SS/T4P/T4SS family [Desulfuromonadaceae bacterium]